MGFRAGSFAILKHGYHLEPSAAAKRYGRDFRFCFWPTR